MKKDRIEKKGIYSRINEAVESVISLSESVENENAAQLKRFLKEAASSVPKSLERGFFSGNRIARKLSILEAHRSLDETKLYLSLIESFGYAETEKVKRKIERIINMLNTEAS